MFNLGPGEGMCGDGFTTFSEEELRNHDKWAKFKIESEQMLKTLPFEEQQNFRQLTHKEKEIYVEKHKEKHKTVFEKFISFMTWFFCYCPKNK